MKKIEADTLEEAYSEASRVLGCSISMLSAEVVQYPSSGILGMFKKPAIIVAMCNKTGSKTLETQEESVATEILSTVKKERPTVEKKEKQKIQKVKKVANAKSENTIVEGFFNTTSKELNPEVEPVIVEETVVYEELALMIETQLTELLNVSCFDIDVVEVDVVGNTALIFIDGEDAALLIGKEGYRYNALSYMIFNWLHTKYELFIKLEIAEFIVTQQEMIKSYLAPVIATVEEKGKGKTRFLDGILVQLALEQLRERFPDKYVSVKTSSKEGKKFIVVNEFFNKSK